MIDRDKFNDLTNILEEDRFVEYYGSMYCLRDSCDGCEFQKECEHVEDTIEIVKALLKQLDDEELVDNIYNVNALIQPITFRIFQLNKLFEKEINIKINIVNKKFSKYTTLYENMNILLIDILKNYTNKNRFIR